MPYPLPLWPVYLILGALEKKFFKEKVFTWKRKPFSCNPEASFCRLLMGTQPRAPTISDFLSSDSKFFLARVPAFRNLYFFMYSTPTKSALMSFRVKVSPFLRPKNLWEIPGIHPPRGKGSLEKNSRKKSPAVMISPFLSPLRGAREAATKSKESHRVNHRFISSVSFSEDFKNGIRIYPRMSVEFR